MIIKDEKNTFELRADKNRRIVYETPVGMMSADNYAALDMAYKSKLVPYLGNGSWMKLCDMRNYKANTSVTPEIVNKHAMDMYALGFKGAAVLLDSTTLKMQINRATKGEAVEIQYFDDEKKADEWLKSLGF